MNNSLSKDYLLEYLLVRLLLVSNIKRTPSIFKKQSSSLCRIPTRMHKPENELLLTDYPAEDFNVENNKNRKQ